MKSKEEFKSVGLEFYNRLRLLTEGVYTIVAHYNAYNDTEAEHIGELGSPYTLDQLKEWVIDGFETVNTYFRGPRIREYCIANDLICVGSTDIHSNKGLNAFVNVKLNNTDDYDLDDVFNALRKNTHEVVTIEGIVVLSHISHHSNFPEIFGDLDMDYIEDFGGYWSNLDKFQVLSWILWSTALFVLFVFVYLRAKKSDIEKLRERIL